MRGKAWAVLCAGLMASGSCSTLAMAQTSGENPSASRPPSVEDGGEIVVTAQRREQSLNDVGLSINVVSGDNLTARGLKTASDLSKAVPGFTAADSSFGVPVYTVRGIGFNDYSLGSNSTVAVYVDEVPLPYPAMTQGAILDLERIEVLKGPQGTLYGANATGGAINYVAQKPTRELHGGVNLGYGRFDTFDADGYLSGALSSNLTARISGSTTQGGSWQYSTTRPGDKLGATHRAAGRLQLDWRPTETLEVDLNANGWRDRSDTQALQLSGFAASNPARIPLLPQLFNTPIAPANARAADWSVTSGFPYPTSYKRDDYFYQINGKISWNLSSDISVTSITAYSRYSQDSFYDRDATPAYNGHYTAVGDIDSIYQELRLAGKTGNLTWSAGANYRHDKIKDFEASDVQESTTTYFAYDFANLISNQKVSTYAFFADGEYAILPKLSVVGGVRYTKDKRTSETCLADTGSGSFARFVGRILNGQRAARGLPPFTIPPGACGVIDRSLNSGHLIDGRLEEDNVSWHAGVNFKPTPQTLLYFSAARGYKAGAFGIVGGILETQFDPIRQEKVDALEAGFKINAFDRLLQLNAAAFRYNYTDKQLRGRILDPVFGSVSKLVNVPRSRITGGEVEAVLRPMRGLSISGSLVYLNAKIREYSGVNLANRVQDFGGEALNFTPKWSANGGFNYEVPLGSGPIIGMLGGDLTYRSKTSAFFGNVPGQEIKSYTTLDLRGGIRNEKQKWSLTFYGRNVTNTYYWSNVVKGSDTLARVAARPVSYGVIVGYTF